MTATRTFYQHRFPAPHIDSVESVIDYQVPAEKVSDLAGFDGSVVVERTAGEVSARCHDEQANFLALNLMHDIVEGAKGVDEARAYGGAAARLLNRHPRRRGRARLPGHPRRGRGVHPG